MTRLAVGMRVRYFTPGNPAGEIRIVTGIGPDRDGRRIVGLSNPARSLHTSEQAHRLLPEGWSFFGSHIDYPGPLELSEETGDDGLPVWERPIIRAQTVRDQQGFDYYDATGLKVDPFRTRLECPGCHKQAWLSKHRCAYVGVRAYTEPEAGNSPQNGAQRVSDPIPPDDSIPGSMQW